MSRNLTIVAAALRRIQEEGDNSNWVIFFADRTRNYYIQFAGEPGSGALYAEAVGSAALAPQDHLSPAQEARLEALGGKPPAHAPNFCLGSLFS